MQQQSQPQTFCQKCGRFIRTQNYLIHEARCKGPTQGGSRSSSRIFNQSRASIVSNQSDRQSNQGQEQKIPCLYCGYPQTLAELDTHPQNCQHTPVACPRCSDLFPKSLMQQHLAICSRNQGNRPYPVYQQMIEGDPQFRRSQEMRYQQQRPQQRQNYEPMWESNRPRFEDSHGPVRYDTYGPIGHTPQPQERYMHENQNFYGPPRQQPDYPGIFDGFMNAFLQPRINDRERYQRRRRQQLQGLIQMLAMTGIIGPVEEQRGLSKEQINKFPKKKYVLKNNGEEEQKCVVCYCDFEKDQQYLELPCKHSFHQECISHWLEKNPTCPVCKHDYGPPRQQRPQNGNFTFRVFRLP